MSYQGNGWSQHHAPQPASARDLARPALSLGMVGTIVSAIFAAGVMWGSYRADMNTLTLQVGELKADVREIKVALPALQATLAQIKDQPRWTMHVEGKR